MNKAELDPLSDAIMAICFIFTAHEYSTTLKKQAGCFNHRVVALVAIMSGLCEVSLVLET